MKRVHWMGSSLKDVKSFPDDVQDEVGFSIYMAQCGDKAINVVPLVGFGGTKVLEKVIDSDRSTYRAVYTVKFDNAIYVLHAFQKKSVKGIATPRPDIELIKKRLRDAEQHYSETYAKRGRERSHETGT